MKKTKLLLICALLFLVGCSAEKEAPETIPTTTESQSIEENGQEEPTTEPETTMQETENEPITDEETEAETVAEVVEKEAIAYSGSGDDVIVVDNPEDEYFILYAKANEDERHFSIKGYDENDKSTELFVNVTIAYEGITIDKTGTTTVLEISSKGDWYIEVRPLSSLRTISIGEVLSGSGDEVLRIEGEPQLATIKGNEEERHFAVKSYKSGSSNLLVNSTKVYEGKNKMKSGHTLLSVSAKGEWEIVLE